MTEKAKEEKGEAFLLYIPKAHRKEFELYKKIVREMGMTISDRIFQMIDRDMEIVLSVVSTIKEIEKKGEKENE